MDFIIESLEPKQFEIFSKMTDKELANKNIVKQIANKKPSFPCRITLEDAEIGEEVFLFNFEFHPAKSPYKASGPIYIRPNKSQKICEANEIPEMFFSRLISVRAYNEKQMLVFADVCYGNDLKEKISKIFEDSKIEYLHLHNAKYGCYLASAIRAK